MHHQDTRTKKKKKKKKLPSCVVPLIGHPTYVTRRVMFQAAKPTKASKQFGPRLNS